jgi:ribose transport system substrate-binding protein
MHKLLHGTASRGSRRRLAVVAVVGLALGAAACSSSSPSATASTGSGSGSANLAVAKATVAKYLKNPTAITQTVPLKSKAPSGKSIIFLTNGQTDGVKIAAGVEAAAHAVGWTSSTVSFDPSNPATLQAAFATALAEHPTFVAEAGEPSSVFGAATIAAYKQAGVPIIVGASVPEKVTNTILGTPNSNVTVIAKMLASWFVSDSKGHGQAILENITAFPILAAFGSEFKADVRQLCPNCTVDTVVISIPQLDAGQVVPTVIAQLQSHPSVKYLIFDQQGFALGINAGLSAAGLTGIQIGGNGIGPEQADALRAGTQQAWTGYSSYYEGYTTVDLALRHLEGMSLAGDDNPQPTQLLTKATIGSVTTTWNRPTDALAQFERLWKVPVTPCTIGCTG